MDNKKTVIRFFTIADYEDEEIWLHNQHMSGWKLVKMIPPCFYIQFSTFNERLRGECPFTYRRFWATFARCF